MKKRDFIRKYGEIIHAQRKDNIFLYWGVKIGAIVSCQGHWNLDIIRWVDLDEGEFFLVKSYEKLDWDTFEGKLKNVIRATFTEEE